MPPPSTSERVAPDRVRVTVASGTRRVDLVLPGRLPVAELLPELARHLGLLDAGSVHGGYRLLTCDGRELGGDTGLLRQGVADGGLLVLDPGIDPTPPRVYDDVVEAVADVVGRELAPWDPPSGRRVVRAAAGLSMGLGAAALLSQLSQRGSAPAGVAATGLAVTLVGAGVVLSRARHEPATAVAVIWLAAAYAAVAGLLLAGRAASGVSVAAAGGGVLLTGVAGLVGLGAGRAWLAAPVLVGTIFLATGLVVRGAGFEPAVVLTTVLVLAVMAGSVLPWLALEATRTRVPPLHSTADLADLVGTARETDAVDPAAVAADVRVAHEILVALSASVGLLLVLVAPLAVSLGRAGTLVSVLAAMVLMLRTRQYHRGAEVLVGVATGLAGLVAVAASALWLHPGWRPAAAAALIASGGVLLAATLLPATRSARRARLGDVAESVSLLLLPPLLVVAAGLFPPMLG